MSLTKIIIKNIASLTGRLLSILPNKYIVLESIPDISDNTKAVFDEMIRRGLNKKYRFVWLCNTTNTKVDIFNTKCAYSKFKKKIYILRAKCIISCNDIIPSFGSYQKSIYLAHGVALKSLNGYKAPTGIDFAIGPSEIANAIMAKELNLSINKYCVTGYPRNDSLNRYNSDKIKSFFDGDYSKIIVWYPTFRQHNISNIASATSHSLPIIHDAESAVKINDVARKLGILIVLKPHFSQNTDYVKDLNLSNMVFITDELFINNNITSYEFVGGCDALITDYSSIYFDYLLCNKPMAAIWEDIDEYRKNRGFAIDVDYYMKGAEIIYNQNDFIDFLNNINRGIDLKACERADIVKNIHMYTDFRSSQRVVDFIEEHCLIGL